MDAADLFYQFLFGSGAWIGFIFFAVVLFIMIGIKRELGVISLVVSMVLAMEYLTHDLGMQALGMAIETVFIILAVAKKKD